jgi:hypothetical protein
MNLLFTLIESIHKYKVNDDINPEIIKKVYEKPIEYTQDIMIRYLKPVSWFEFLLS